MSGSAAEVARAICERQSFILTSHARPDGDAIGSQLALAFALDDLGKSVRLVDRDPVPNPYRVFPGAGRIELGNRLETTADAVVLLECSDLTRPDIAGLDRHFLINIDHHAGNGMYAAVNWFDETAAACGEMVADLIDALGVRWTQDIASHLYLAIATDTGGFRYGNLTARTFEVCQRIAATGLHPSQISRQIFDSFGIGRVKLTGALLGAMELYYRNRLAVLYLDDELLAACGAVIDDTEGLVNLPLNAKEVLAVALFKQQAPESYRVSLRSKGDINVRLVALRWAGGGHQNAAGFTAIGAYADVKGAVVQEIENQLKIGKANDA